MNKAIILLGLFIAILGCAEETVNGKNIQGFPLEEISQSEIEALDLAINDEYKAQATYQKVIDKFGEIRPFSNIIQAEQMPPAGPRDLCPLL